MARASLRAVHDRTSNCIRDSSSNFKEHFQNSRNKQVQER
jgi:hypothetical protein